MIHKIIYFLLFLFLSHFSYSQILPTENSKEKNNKDSASISKYPPSNNEISIESDSINTAPKEIIISPIIGLGTGMFSFYGDMYTKHFQAPMVSRLAFDLIVSQPLNDFLLLNFRVTYGKLGANERFSYNNRNLNFESTMRIGGLNLEYNFDNFLPKNRTASPYISLGVESFEFLSKTDLKDQNGSNYFYWSDGSIRNIDEQATDANLAVEINRDYKYESDIRELNLDGFGKYPERSFAIPVGIGATFKINDFINFKIGATLHFTFTDYIDGITEKSIGFRQGNKQNDNFMMTSFSLHYNLGRSDKRKEMKKTSLNMENHYKDIDFSELDLLDQDKDGVVDWNDLCQGTPEGVPVDANGCPLDDDKDGVPNYRDDEIKSPIDALVNTRGLQMSDSLIAYQYRFYMDSTGEFGSIENRDFASTKSGRKEYTVELGTFRKGLPSNLMTKFLSISDISSDIKSDSSTIYTAGKFDNIKDAERRKQQLINEGLSGVKVVYKLNSKYYDIKSKEMDPEKSYSGFLLGEDKTPLANSKVNLMNAKGEVLNTTTTDDLGAFHFSPLPYPKEDLLIALDEKDTKLKKFKKIYLTDDKSNKATEVYPNNVAFNIVNNKNIASSLSNSSKKGVIKNTAINKNTATINHTSSKSINTPGIVMRVQLGAYKKRLPKAVFKDVNDLIEMKTDDGLYKYLTGSFTTIESAATLKVEMILNGYPGAFIAAYKDGERISLKDAGATIAENENILETPENTIVSGVNKNLVKFKVQIGVFKSQPPQSMLAIFSKLKDINEEKTTSGLMRYVVGSFNSYLEAEALKNELIKKYGLSGSFVVSTFKNSYISIPEAMEILK